MTQVDLNSNFVGNQGRLEITLTLMYQFGESVSV